MKYLLLFLALYCSLWTTTVEGASSALRFSEKRSNEDEGEERGLFLSNQCSGCGSFRNRMRRISADDSCEERCRLFFLKRSSNWECGTCEEWRESYPGFDATLYFRRVKNANRRKVFQQAADRWQQAIIGDLPSILFTGQARRLSSFCPARSIPRVVDDVFICVSIRPIDGQGGILGQAGAEFVRTNSTLPLLGGMIFDSADVDFLVGLGSFDEVVLHEMGHVFGIMSLVWSARGLIDSILPPCSYKFDSAASREWRAATGCSTSIPIENNGGGGTACSHFDEDLLTDELMTGFLGLTAPILSRLTIATLEDIGYEVDYSSADAFNVAISNCPAPRIGVESSSEDSGRLNAIQYGKQVLQDRATPEVGDNIQLSASNIEYVGDQSVSIIYMDDLGQVRHVDVTNT